MLLSSTKSLTYFYALKRNHLQYCAHNLPLLGNMNNPRTLVSKNYITYETESLDAFFVQVHM